MLETFLESNGGTWFPVNDADAVIAMLKLVAGDTSDEAFTDRVRANLRVPTD
jgi:hypothetical protein